MACFEDLKKSPSFFFRDADGLNICGLGVLDHLDAYMLSMVLT